MAFQVRFSGIRGTANPHTFFRQFEVCLSSAGSTLSRGRHLVTSCPRSAIIEVPIVNWNFDFVIFDSETMLCVLVLF